MLGGKDHLVRGLGVGVWGEEGRVCCCCKLQFLNNVPHSASSTQRKHPVLCRCYEREAMLQRQDQRAVLGGKDHLLAPGSA